MIEPEPLANRTSKPSMCLNSESVVTTSDRSPLVTGVTVMFTVPVAQSDGEPLSQTV